MVKTGHEKGDGKRKMPENVMTVLRRFFKGRCFLEGFLEGTCKGLQ